MTALPKISIVTPSFNQGKYLEKTILSVIEQRYPNLEYIIIDGGSTDNSVEIIRKYEHYLAYWVSEPDRGQSHAINKGFARATGDIFGWLNSDDWYHPGALKAVAEAFLSSPDTEVVVGGGDYVDDVGRIITRTIPSAITLETLYSWFDHFFWQPSCFFSRRAWETVGPLDESLHLAMDYDLWLRIAKIFAFITIDNILSSTLKHSEAKTTAQIHESDHVTLKLVLKYGGENAFNIVLASYTRRLEQLEEEHRVEISTIRQDVVKKQKDILRLNKQLGAMQGTLQRVLNSITQVEKEKQDILDSLSWKITKPVRSIIDTLKGQQAIGDKNINTTSFDIFPLNDGSLRPLQFPQGQVPLISIIIPVHNLFSYTWSCLQSIHKNTAGIPYEIIIADDASTDRTIEIGKYALNVSVVRNDPNLGFLRNCNHAACSAQGDYIVLLNNDVNVQPDWLHNLVDLIESDEKIGMVGAKLVFPDGTIQEAGGIVWNDGSAFNYGRNDDPNRPEYNYVKEVDYVSGACLLIRRNIWEEACGFDERFAPAYYEDTDLAFTVRKLGYKVMYQPRSVAVHFEGKSHGTDLGKGIKNYQVLNQKSFFEKWKEDLQIFQCQPDNLFFARDRSQGKRHIFVSDIWVPEHDRNAGARCTRQYLELFREMGFQITYHSRDTWRREPYATEIEQLGIELLLGLDLSEWMANNLSCFDYIYMHRPDSVLLLESVQKYKRPDAKIFYFAHDLHHVRLRRRYEIEKEPSLLAEAEQFEAKERTLFASADVIHVVGEYEAAIIQQQYPGKTVRDIPLFLFRDEKLRNLNRKSVQERSGLLFVGSFGHRPNVDAVLWFMQEVWPAVCQSLPDAHFYIAGSDPPDEIQVLDSERVHVTGYISDDELSHLYCSCRMLIIPLRYGAGVKGKILEGMFHGIPVMTTPVGAEGIPCAERVLVVRHWEDGWALPLNTAYNNHIELENRSKAAYTLLMERFSVAYAKTVMLNDMELGQV